MTSWLDALTAGPPGTNGTNGTNGVGLEVTASGGTTCTSATTGNVDQLVYTVPASPSGAGRFILTGITLRVSTALVGIGTCTITAGTTAGATDLLTATAITSASTVGTIIGLDLSSLGTLCISSDGYNAKLAAGATVYVRMAASSTISTAPIFAAHVYGMAQ